MYLPKLQMNRYGRRHIAERTGSSTERVGSDEFIFFTGLFINIDELNKRMLLHMVYNLSIVNKTNVR